MGRLRLGINLRIRYIIKNFTDKSKKYNGLPPFSFRKSILRRKRENVFFFFMKTNSTELKIYVHTLFSAKCGGKSNQLNLTNTSNKAPVRFFSSNQVKKGRKAPSQDRVWRGRRRCCLPPPERRTRRERVFSLHIDTRQTFFLPSSFAAAYS